jgi:hypothetical protein
MSGNRKSKAKIDYDRRRAERENQRFNKAADAHLVWRIRVSDLRDANIRNLSNTSETRILDLLWSVLTERLPTHPEDTPFTIVIDGRISQLRTDYLIRHINAELESAGIHWRLRNAWVRSDLGPQVRTFIKCTPFGLADLVGRIKPDSELVLEDWYVKHAHHGHTMMLYTESPNYNQHRHANRKQGFPASVGQMETKARKALDRRRRP